MTLIVIDFTGKVQCTCALPRCRVVLTHTLRKNSPLPRVFALLMRVTHVLSCGLAFSRLTPACLSLNSIKFICQSVLLHALQMRTFF